MPDERARPEIAPQSRRIAQRYPHLERSPSVEEARRRQAGEIALEPWELIRQAVHPGGRRGGGRQDGHGDRVLVYVEAEIDYRD